MKRLKLSLTALLLLLPTLLISQSAGGVDPASLLKPLADSWPTYSGDYTGRRYSTLKQIDRNTVRTLLWAGSAE
jgi:alcohol dehydrogenase (cytochrome c)